MKMVYLLLNMKSLLSCYLLCASNHVRVQLLVIEINLLMASTFTHQVILKIINLWSYKIVKLYKHIMVSVLCGLKTSVPLSLYLEYFWMWLVIMLKFHQQDIFMFTSLFLNIYIPVQNSYLTVSTNMWSDVLR